MEMVKVETVDQTTIKLTVRPDTKDAKWSGYDCEIITDEGFALTIKGASIWGLRSWARAMPNLLETEVSDKLHDMIREYPF
jgi:hypothetical protein